MEWEMDTISIILIIDENAILCYSYFNLRSLLPYWYYLILATSSEDFFYYMVPVLRTNVTYPLWGRRFSGFACVFPIAGKITDIKIIWLNICLAQLMHFSHIFHASCRPGCKCCAYKFLFKNPNTKTVLSKQLNWNVIWNGKTKMQIKI